MGISSAGIGSGLYVENLVKSLMAAESAPLAHYAKKTSALQARMAAFGKLSSAIGSFQGALTSLSSSSTFRALTATSANKDILGGTATSTAAPGTYKVSVTQLAQAQSLNTGGKASMSAMIGSGAPTTLTFQFGTVSGGTYGVAGTALGAAATSSGIANGSLTINGTAIATGAATRSARELAAAINAQTQATGVTASAGATATSATLFGGAAGTSFGAVDTGTDGSYTLAVAGVTLATQGPNAPAGSEVTAATIDDALTGNTSTTAALAAANITFTGKASDGTLQFFAADGANITVSETVGGTVTGGLNNSGTENIGSSVTASSGVTLTSSSASAIAVGGSNPALAGLAAGTGGSYLGAGFAQDGAIASGTVTLDAGSQSLQGIRDAINKANIGVTATIVSDGSDTPYHLVLSSNKTGANASMKISVDGVDGQSADPGIAALLAYDPAGVQQLNQTSAAQSTLLNVNGIPVTSSSNNVADAIQGVTLNVTSVGSTTLTVNRDSASVTDAVNAFVKAYNDLNKTISGLTAYNPETKTGGPLQGDATVRSIQSQLRKQLGNTIPGLGGKLTSLSQVGIAFGKDGSLAVDSSKLNKAITENFADIGGLFAAIGTASDGLVSFAGSSAATKPGTYALNVTSMASQGTLASAAPLLASTTIAANTTWTVTLNQTDPASETKVQNIAIPAGTYTPTQIASMLRATINGNAAFAGAGDTVETTVDAASGAALASVPWLAMLVTFSA